MDPRLQLEMAERIPDATLHRFDAGHIACVKPAFGDALATACHDVAGRI